MLRPIALVTVCLVALSARAEAGDRIRLMEIPLGMPLEEELEGEYLEGIYQEKLLPDLVDSVLYETPIARIQSTFKHDRKLEIWFTSIEDGRRAYWLKLDQSFPDTKPIPTQNLRDDFAKQFGAPDLIVGGVSNDGAGPVVLVRVDPNLEETSRGAVLQALNDDFKPEPQLLSEFWHMDMRQREKLLGPDFRGAVLSYYESAGKASSMTLELLDLTMARTVLNLGPQEVSP